MKPSKTLRAVERAELWQDGMMVACVETSSRKDTEREINHYALMYAQDGPVTIKWRHAAAQRRRKVK